MLRSAGEPLDPRSKSLMESRFGHDFSSVRLHTDVTASGAGSALNADAYTVGHHIGFSQGLYRPGTPDGDRLLAHELGHVVQQSVLGDVGERTSRVSSPASPAEREAEEAAKRVVLGHAVSMRVKPEAMVHRRMRVVRPRDPIPTQSPEGQRTPTNAESVEGYLRTLSPEGSLAVNRSTGDVTTATAFCPGVLGGAAEGGRAGYRIGHGIGSAGGNIPLFGPIFGAIGAVIGGLVGGIAGLFGARMSRAASSRTPVSATCLCEFVHSSRETLIELEDQESPLGSAQLVRVPSPNATKRWGSASTTGALRFNEPWLILAHELCGHAWRQIHARGEREEGPREELAPGVGRNPVTGQLEIQEREGGFEGPTRQPRASHYLRHGRTVDRENLIRAEHGIEPRGYRLRDPYCGESFWQQRGDPTGPLNWQRQSTDDHTYLEQCEHLRSLLPESRRRRYRIDERIP